MKKLLILGGSRYVLPVIKVAHDLGLYVITCDYLPNNIAHKYSDEYCNVSIIDKEATLEAAKRLKIDGVMSFACDPGVTTAAYVAEQLNLPSCGSYDSVCILQNKGLFREFLAKHNFNVPMAKSYTSVEDAIADVNIFNWPVIVKPTDSAGSKGVLKISDESELIKGIEYALSYSHKNEFIIEDYIEKVGFSSDTDCFSVDGVLKFISFNSQRFDENAENPYTPAAYSWPSSMTDCHKKELEKELQRLISLLGMKTSIYNVETREGTNGKVYIMEVSPRGGGNRLSECLEMATGVDLIANSIRAALGMPIVNLEQKPYNGNWAEIILHSDKPGVFKELLISEDIKNCVVEEDLWIEKGHHVGGFTAANEAIGTVILRFNDAEELNKVMNNVNHYVKIVLQ